MRMQVIDDRIQRDVKQKNYFGQKGKLRDKMSKPKNFYSCHTMDLMPMEAVKVIMGRNIICRRASGIAVPKTPRIAKTAPLAPRDIPARFVATCSEMKSKVGEDRGG